ncbi:hypothetical protein Mgra_00005068, partial [Meloidogyne graminicola]
FVYLISNIIFVLSILILKVLVQHSTTNKTLTRMPSIDISNRGIGNLKTCNFLLFCKSLEALEERLLLAKRPLLPPQLVFPPWREKPPSLPKR